MADVYLGEIRLFSFGRIPQGWMACNGQNLPVSTNQALYSLLGVMYGGTIGSNFNLPDLRGRVPVDTNYGSIPLGGKGGEASVTLTVNNVPAHGHNLQATTADGNDTNVANALYAKVIPSSTEQIYGPLSTPMVAMDPAILVASGGNTPHNNMQPYLAVSYCIATQGNYPPRPN